MKVFEKKIEIKWADVDQNRHVRHSAYYDYGAFVRIKFMSEAGFGAYKMSELNIGPILFKEGCSFIKEVHPDDILRVNVLGGSMSEDGSRWTLYHELFNQNNEKVAHISAVGAWMDTEKRKLTTPPIELAKAFQSLTYGEEYVYKKSV
jgi:acyl-CoA thioester hydrolase